MATLTQHPCPTKFVGDMQDMILTSADSVEFQLKQAETLVLKETYNPANGSIRIGGLDKVIDTCLYGELKDEYIAAVTQGLRPRKLNTVRRPARTNNGPVM